MKMPTWVYIVGLLMILFGIYKFQSNLQLLITIQLFELIGNVSNTNLMEEFCVSDVQRTWIVRFAYMGLLSWFLFIVGGLSVLSKTTYSIPIAYGAIALNILFLATSCIVFAPKMNLLYGLFVDLILVVVIWISDKSVYYVKK